MNSHTKSKLLASKLWFNGWSEDETSQKTRKHNRKGMDGNHLLLCSLLSVSVI